MIRLASDWIFHGLLQRSTALFASLQVPTQPPHALESHHLFLSHVVAPCRKHCSRALMVVAARPLPNYDGSPFFNRCISSCCARQFWAKRRRAFAVGGGLRFMHSSAFRQRVRMCFFCVVSIFVLMP